MGFFTRLFPARVASSKQVQATRSTTIHIDVAQCIRALAYLLFAVAALIAAINSGTARQLATALAQIIVHEPEGNPSDAGGTKTAHIPRDNVN
ncbi:MAG TPA: hypothetical protein VF548_17955 [Allosphingosinicella sp.]|jgi:hypothetical protein